MREADKIVFGFGEHKTPQPFIKACDKFIYVEILSMDLLKIELLNPKELVPEQSRERNRQLEVSNTDIGMSPKLVDKELSTLLVNTIEAARDDDSWAFLGVVGNMLSKKMPDFDPPNYGLKKLTQLIKYALSNNFELAYCRNELPNTTLVYIRNK
ncbi:OST-HTH/LOTUS domain-containing protein [Tidjanibacter massiliensis]|uniref:OST-HTH/LOTUS domain-containing protein n=1 Tax=Tidjanibacter massiliensis TaxID=1871003 RepID=UPI0037DD412B